MESREGFISPFKSPYERGRGTFFNRKDVYMPPRSLKPEDLKDPNKVPRNYYFRELQVEIPELRRVFESLVFLKIGRGKERVGGTGFLIGREGLVATNAHNLMNLGSKEKIAPGQVHYKGREISLTNARVIFESRNFRELDLALIEIPELSNLPPITIGGNNDMPVKGDTVFSLGYPAVYKCRVPVLSCGTVLEYDTIDHTIKHNCQVNPGMSGGPLINKMGFLVGVIRGVPNVPGFNLVEEFTSIALALDLVKIKEAIASI